MDSIKMLPVTIGTLFLVTSVVNLKLRDNTALLVENDPESESDRPYRLLDFSNQKAGSAATGIKNVGDGGIRTIVRILEAVTGQPFVLVTDSDTELHFRRKDFHEKVLAFEAGEQKKREP